MLANDIFAFNCSVVLSEKSFFNYMWHNSIEGILPKPFLSKFGQNELSA